MGAAVILMEIDTVSPAGAPETLRFSDRAIRPFPPSDPDRANLEWDDCLAEPPTWRRALFEDMASLTPSIGSGGLTLQNTGGHLNGYKGHAWNEIRVWRWTEGTPFAAAVLELTGLCAQPQFDHRTSQARQVRCDLYDYRAELERPPQSTLYAGGNDGASVLYEGSADGLKGRVKPLAYGDLTDAHLEPIQVNAGQYVFQVHDGQVEGEVAIFDGGAPAGYADQGDKVAAVFDTTLPAPASYFTSLGRGLIKINGSPVMGLTFGVKGANVPTYVETAGPIAARLLARRGVPAGRIGASVAGLVAPAVVGVYSAAETPTGELLAWTARSALTAVLPDRTGVYQAYRFGPPAAVADATIEVDQALELAADETTAGPVGEIRVAWGRIWTTFGDGQLKASVRSSPEAERLRAGYRYATRELAEVKGRFPRGWSVLEVETALRREEDALALLDELEALFGLRADGSPRQAWRVTIWSADGISADLGQTVRLRYPPQDIDDNFVLIAEEPMRPTREQTIWTLWG